LTYCLWKCTMGMQPFWKQLGDLIKLNVQLLYDPAIPLLSIYPKRNENVCSHACTPMFIVASFIIAKNRKQPENASISKRRNKQCCIHMMQHCTAIVRKKLLIWTATWMHLKCSMLSGRSQTQNVMIPLYEFLEEE
ncbi:LORF2 protein, partial [Crocuta crocuta]